MQVHSRSMSVIRTELWMFLMTHRLDASLQEHVSNWIWALNVHGDSLPGCKFTGACQQLNLSSEFPWWLTAWMQVHRSISAIGFEFWMHMVTHILNAHSQEHISNWIWALNVLDDSQAGGKFTGACQQFNLSSEYPWWLTAWMQVHRSMSAIEFKLWMSLVTHSLDASSQKHVSNWIWALNVLDDSHTGCKFTEAYQQLNLNSNCLDDSQTGYKFTGACQQLSLSSPCSWWLTP